MANATDFKVKRGLVVSTTATILSTTNATSTTTGALIVAGGAGIAKDLFVAGTISAVNTASALVVRSNINMVSPDAASTITIRMLNSDAISFSGNSGQLFSITDSMTGTIFAVNDISGVPSIEVYDTGEVRLAETFGYVRIPNFTSATSTTTGALRVDGGVGIGGSLYVGGIVSATTVSATTVTATTLNGNLTGSASTSTNLSGGATGSIPYQTVAGRTSFIGIGSIGQILQSNGTTATWVSTGSLIAGTAFTATTLLGGTAGQIHYQSAPNVTAFAGPGTAGQLLVSAGTSAPVYTSTASIYVGNSARVDTSGQTANASYFPTFVDSNNASAGGESVFTTSSFVINPSTGNVGIGGAPSYKLDINGGTLGSTLGNQIITQRLAVSSANADSLEISNLRTAAGSDWTTAGWRLQQKVDATWMGYIQFNGVGNQGGIAFGTGLTTTSPDSITERLRITPGGNFGIGITAPTSKLHVSGDARITGITTVTNNTAASSTITGAFQVVGGIGIGGNSYIGGNEVVTGTLRVNSTNANTATNTSNAFYTAGGAWIDKTLVVGGETTFKGSVVFQGTNTFVYSSSTVYTDNLISLHAPSGSTPGSHTWTVDDGKDIGFLFHYYKGADRDAFLGFANDTQYLEWYSNGVESGGVFTGTTYGIFKTGGIRLVGGESNSGNTTTGSLQVLGGVGISGGVFVSGTVTATNFVGAFSGSITGAATQVNTVQQTANATYFPTFVDSNNASAGGESVFTTSSFSINPSSGSVTIGNATHQFLFNTVNGQYAGPSIIPNGSLNVLYLGPNGTKTVVGGNGSVLGGTLAVRQISGQPAFTVEDSGASLSWLVVNSSGNVGIGTSSPTFKVDTSLGSVNNNTTNYGYNIFADASGNVGYSGYNLQLNNSTGNATGFIRLARTASTAYLGMEIQSQSRDGIRFLTHATVPVEVARIDASGNVGIGATPASRLHVEGASVATNIIATSGNGSIRLSNSVAGATRKEFTTILDTTNNRVDLQAVQQGVAFMPITINAGGGNVGIGTISPASKLHVDGDARITGITTVTNTTTSISTTTGAFQVAGGIGVGDSVYVKNRVGFVSTSNTSVVYQVYNTIANSLDTVFG